VKTKSHIKKILRENYGSVSTYLERKYVNQLTEELLSTNQKNKEFWATYNQVILELKNTLQDSLKVKELQYRLTDAEDPQNACLDVLEGVKLKNPELERLYYKIRNF
jgi:hypothetical protein